MGLPEASLVKREFVVRDMELTREVRMTKKSLLRWVALSLGLISPNESRTILLDVLEALFYFQYGGEIDPNVEEIMEYLGKRGKEGGVGEKAVRYHLLQLKNKGLIDRKKGKYFFVSSPLSERGDVGASIDYVYKQGIDGALSKVVKSLNELKRMYSK